MSANEHLSPDQFPRRRFKVQNSPDGFPSWVADVPVSHLTSLADPISATTQGTDRLTTSIRDRGFDPSKHKGFNQWGHNSEAAPIHLTYHDVDSPRLLEGNHRAWAAQQAGLTHLPVTITDFRQNRGNANK